MIRVFIADDEPIILEGLQNLLSNQPDIEIVGQTSITEDMIQLIEQAQSDVIIMDALMPDTELFDVLNRLHALPHSPGILIFSASGESTRVYKILDSGVCGYFLRCDDLLLLPEAVRAVAIGLPCTSPTMRQRLLDASPNTLSEVLPDVNAKFSESEQHILTLLAQGKKNQEIADLLHIAESTVRYHLRNINGKLPTSARGEMIVWAVQHGFGSNS